MADEREPKQKTRPAKGKPIEIALPRREDLVKRVAQGSTAAPAKEIS